MVATDIGNVKNIIREGITGSITPPHPKSIADRMGYTETIEASGAKFAADTCCVVAPIKGRFNALATDSAKACYYAYGKNNFKTAFLPFDEVVRLSTL